VSHLLIIKTHKGELIGENVDDAIGE